MTIQIQVMPSGLFGWWRPKGKRYMAPLSAAPREVRQVLLTVEVPQAAGLYEVDVPLTPTRLKLEHHSLQDSRDDLGARIEIAALVLGRSGVCLAPIPPTPEMFFCDPDYAVSRRLPCPRARGVKWEAAEITREVVLTPQYWLVRVTSPDGGHEWRTGCPTPWLEFAPRLCIGWESALNRGWYAVDCYRTKRDDLDLYFRVRDGYLGMRALRAMAQDAELAVRTLHRLAQGREGWKKLA